ncbi:MAG: arsenate reductase [Methylotenera sp.]|jgi:Spx/MgsR family transcriptional regulator|nr:arsenate reductase [Methylotenera sp.]
MQLFGIPNCSTVKKARDWLDQHDCSYRFHDFKKNVLTEALLKDWLDQTSLDKLINRAGMTWRNLSEAEKASAAHSETARQLMLTKPSLIKRPVLIKDGKLACLGFSQASYEALL